VGRIQDFFYHDNNFLDGKSVGSPTWSLPVTHPFHLATLIMFISHILLIPIGYYRLFSFVKQNNSNLGDSISAKSRVRKKQQNLVSAKFNFLNWLLEAVSLVIVLSGYNKVTTVVYILLTSCGPPCIYFLGVEEQRRAVRRYLSSRINNIKQVQWTENVAIAKEHRVEINREQREKIGRDLREREEKTMKEKKEREKNQTVKIKEEILRTEVFANIDDDSREIYDDVYDVQAMMDCKNIEEGDIESIDCFKDAKILQGTKKNLGSVVRNGSWME